MQVGCRDGTVCGWREPPLRHFVGEPICSVEANGTYPNDGATLSGALYRVTTCELQYGPMNCDFIWGASNEYVFTCPIWPLQDQAWGPANVTNICSWLLSEHVHADQLPP